jgi:hypothetical protein
MINIPPTSTHPYNTGLQKQGKVRIVKIVMKDTTGDSAVNDSPAIFFISTRKLIAAGKEKILTMERMYANRLVPNTKLNGSRRNAAILL